MLYTNVMRLDKFLCELNIGSRSELKKIIKTGSVSVNGSVVNDPGLLISENSDKVTYKGELLVYEKYVYYMLNKPSGYVSATNDNTAPAVTELLNAEGRDDLFPVGRLDKDTVGLLIITNDGDLGHRLTSPKHHAPKEYLVSLRDDINEDAVSKLESGIDLGEDGITKPAKVRIVDSKTIILTITEGKFHQVKRMLLAVSNEVVFLKRLSMGGVSLDENLKEGEYRRLSADEISILQNNA